MKRMRGPGSLPAPVLHDTKGGHMSDKIRLWRVKWTATVTTEGGEEKRFPVMVAPVGAATAAEAVMWVLGVSLSRARRLLRDGVVQAEEIK